MYRYNYSRFDLSASGLILIAVLAVLVAALYIHAANMPVPGNLTNEGGVAVSVADPGHVKLYLRVNKVQIVAQNGTKYTIMNRTMEINMSKLRDLNITQLLAVAYLPPSNYTHIIICPVLVAQTNLSGFTGNITIERVLPGSGFINWTDGCLIITLPKPIRVVKGNYTNVTLDFTFDENVLINSLLRGDKEITIYVTPLISKPMPWSVYHHILDRMKEIMHHHKLNFTEPHIMHLAQHVEHKNKNSKGGS